MKKHVKSLMKGILSLGILTSLVACLNPLTFNPESEIDLGHITTTDVTAAVLLLTNRSKTVDVTSVTITQPEWVPSAENPNAQTPSISFANKPKRLEQKAQYLTPSDKSYQVVINYIYDAWNTKPAGSGTQTLIVSLPLPRQIVEYIIYRNENGEVMIDKEIINPDPDDTGIPVEDPSPGEGSSPAIILPQDRTRMATFIVISKTSSQIIDNVNFKMGEKNYTMGRIGANDRQSIALGQGSWETRLKYTREDTEKTLGPVNSIIVPSNDPQATREHYLYFYLNKRGDYAISQDWPPFPNDVEEEDLLPVDTGYGRGLIKIVNNTNAIAKTVTIHNLHNSNSFPWIIDYDGFTPPIPIQNNRTGYVDVVGTADFPIEGHDGYLIQVTMETNNGFGIIDRKAYIKDQVITIIIDPSDLHLNNTRGAKVILSNETNSWPVEITALTVRNKANYYQSSYFDTNTWRPQGSVKKDKNAAQYVMSIPAMPIVPTGEFEAVVTIYGNGVSVSINKDILPAVLYSDDSPDQNTRTITITDSDVPPEIKDGHNSGGAKFTINNNTSVGNVQIVDMMVRNKTNNDQYNYYGASTWTPKTVIDKGRSAEQMVYSSANMPIMAGIGFEAVLTILGNGNTETVIKNFTPAVLYVADKTPEQNTRTISIEDSDVPAHLITPPEPPTPSTKGANVTIHNDVSSWQISIVGMTVQNNTRTAEKTSYYWDAIGNHQNGTQMVMESATMPITSSNETFSALLYLIGNGQTAMVTTAFNPSSVLYSADKTPEQNTRTITISDGDIPNNLKPPIIPDPDPEQDKMDEIFNARIGGIIDIDGILWIKAKADSSGNVLLLKEGVIPGGFAPMNTYLFHPNVNYKEYADAKIRTDVDKWYRDVQSPILKKIALTPSIPSGGTGASTAGTLAGTSAYELILFIPRYADISNLASITNTQNNLGNTLAMNYEYWLTDFVPIPGINQQPRMGLIKGDGSFFQREAANHASVRPVIWVRTRK